MWKYESWDPFDQFVELLDFDIRHEMVTSKGLEKKHDEKSP